MPQEIIYLPPSGGASDESSFAARLAGAVELAAPAPARTEDSFTDLQAFTAPTLGGEARERGGYERTVGSFDSSAASVAALNGGEPGNTIGSFANGGGGGNEAAFSGVLAPIPEPSTWAMMLSGAGVLFAVLPRRKRRE